VDKTSFHVVDCFSFFFITAHNSQPLTQPQPPINQFSVITVAAGEADSEFMKHL